MKNINAYNFWRHDSRELKLIQPKRSKLWPLNNYFGCGRCITTKIHVEAVLSLILSIDLIYIISQMLILTSGSELQATVSFGSECRLKLL
jgi:hypothetical protein